VTLYARRNRLGDGLNLLKYYYDNSEIKHGADTKDLDISYQGKMIVGKFIDREKPTFLDAMNTHMTNVLGDKFVPYGENK
jgi:2-oxoglutarate ferredoxin oxidoreductase subunit beta